MVAEKDGSMIAKKYDKIHKNLMDYILSGQMHSTLIGMQIAVDSSSKDNDLRNVEQFVEYITGLIARADDYANNVKA